MADTAVPITRCSHSRTVFEIPEDILRSKDSRVRCGECIQIFDAVENQYSTDLNKVNKPLDESATRNTSAIDVTYSDFDLFSEEADLPEIAYIDQIKDSPDFDFDSVDLANDETFSDTLFKNDVTIDAEISPNKSTTTNNNKPVSMPREPIVFKYEED